MFCETTSVLGLLFRAQRACKIGLGTQCSINVRADKQTKRKVLVCLEIKRKVTVQCDGCSAEGSMGLQLWRGVVFAWKDRKESLFLSRKCPHDMQIIV